MPPPPSDSYEPSGLPSPPLARDLDPRASAQLGVHHHPHYASIPHPFDKTLEEGEKSSRGTSHLQSLASLADSSHSYITSNTPLYSTNKGVIDDALKTLSSAGSGGSSGKNGLVDDWLNPVNKVIKGLEGLVKAQPFPFLSLGVSLFSGVVKLEVERRTNNIKARALVLQMADMMSALLQLHYVRDPTAVSSTGDSIQSRFHTLMRYIESDIKSCGALINKHHQHSKFTKWLRAGDYSELYTSAAGNLANRKGEIKFACTIHVTVGVEEVRRNVHDTNTLLRRVIAIIEHKSDDEREFDKVVNQHGGTERIRDNPDVALQVHARFEKLREAAHASRQNPSSKSLPVSKAPTSRHSSATKGEPSFDRKELLELQQPLEKIVKDSLPFFEGKLIAQVEILRDEIDKSTQQILARLEAGAHDKIVHPDVQYVWKDMGWRSSVGAKVFVLALHDYYVDRYALAAARSAHDPNLTLVHSTPVGSPNAELPQHSPLPSANLEIVPTTPAIQQDFTTSDAIILADKPFFDYLTMPFVNAIIQAFDDDASGFVRISEVNEFCESIPEGWTLLQWIAYWARGWLVETSYYAHAIGSLLQSMEEGLAESLAENHNVIYNYLTHQSWIGVVRSVAWCAASKSATKTDTPLDDLIAISMAKKEERLEKNLARFQFLLDTPEALKLICDSGRIEKDIFALLFILLRRHVRLVSLAKERVIDEREFLDAQNTLVQIAQTITQRVEEMQSNFRTQGMDVDAEMGRFAGGVYEFLHTGSVPEDVDAPCIPAEDFKEWWGSIMPEDLDLKQFRNFVNPDMWFDESTSVPSSALPIPVVMVDRGSPSPREMMADHVRRTGRRPGTPKKRLPLLVPRAFEFLSMVSEHRDDLPSIRKEISSFLQQMNEAVRGKAQWTYLPRALTGAQDLLREVNSVRLRDHFFLKIYINVVRFACSLAKLPSVESMDPHVGFFFGMRKILEPISINLALILRLVRLKMNSEQPVSIELTQAEAGAVVNIAQSNPKSTWDDRELAEAVSRMARHGPQIATAVDLHTGSGLARFRAAARTVLADIQDRYYRYSWPFFKRHEATRRLFVAAYATKMRFDVANEYWGITLPGSKPAEETYAGLLREVSSAARSLWSALARLEYRKTVVHMASRCDHCEDVIVGPRYACLYCDDIDLCHSCAQLKLRPFRDRGRRLHHSWHPYMKIDRPIIKLSPHIRSQFKMIVDDLQSQESSSSTSSDELIAFDPTDDLDDYYTAGEAADRRSAYTLLSGDGQDVPVETLLARKRAQARYRFRCSSCAETKMGVRFILPNDDSVNYMCQLCERAQTVRPSNQPLPPHLRLTLRISLPLPDDDDISSIGSSEEDDDVKLLKRQVTSLATAHEQRHKRLEERLSTLESRMEGVEQKLDLIIALLQPQQLTPRTLNAVL